MKKTAWMVLLAAALLTASFFIWKSQDKSGTLHMSMDANALWKTKGVYISPGGNDGNRCANTQPCRTLNRAISVAQPGEVIHLLEGHYPEVLDVSASGTAQNRLVIAGQDAVLPGVVVSGNYIVISGLEVSGSISHGILVKGRHIIVEDSIVHHSVTENGEVTCLGHGGWGSALKVMMGGEDVIFRRNLVYENCGEGIAVTRGVKVLVENNIVRDNFSVNIYVDNSSYTVVRDNTVYCTGIYLREQNRPAGIAVAEEFYEGWGAQRHDNKIIGNQVSNCHSGITSWESEMPTGMEIRLLIEDNIVFGTIGSLPIALLTRNEDVIVRNNKTDKPIKIEYPDGAISENNTLIEPAQ